MIAADRIPWVRVRGFGRPVDHAVAGINSGWVSTFCDHYTPSWRQLPGDAPERKCRACVSRLAAATAPANLDEMMGKWRNAYPAPAREPGR